MAKGLFDKFCAEVGVKPEDVTEEITPTSSSAVPSLDVSRDDDRVIGIKQCTDNYNTCGSAIRFDFIQTYPGYTDEKSVEESLEKADYRGDLKTCINSVLREFADDIKTFPEPNCHGVVRCHNCLAILKYPFYNGSNKNLIFKLVKKYKHVMVRSRARGYRSGTGGSMNEDDVRNMGFKPGYGWGGTLMIHDAKPSQVVCTSQQIWKVTQIIGGSIAKKLGRCGDRICWFSGYPKAKKVDYAEFVVNGLKAAGSMGADTKDALRAIAELPHENLLKDKDKRLRDLGKLVEAIKGMPNLVASIKRKAKK